MNARGVEEFLPLYSLRRQWSDRSKLVELPLFPRYTFGRLDRAEQSLAKQVPGVRSIVGFEAGAVQVDDCEIDSIRAMVDSRLALTPRALFIEGQRVRVEHGPLADSCWLSRSPSTRYAGFAGAGSPRRLGPALPSRSRLWRVRWVLAGQ